MFKVTRSAVKPEDQPGSVHQWPVGFKAIDIVAEEPAKIFVMQAALPPELPDAMFSCVASAVQMEDLPEDSPDPDGPYFRVDEFTVLCRSATAADEFSEKVFAAIQDLVDNIAASEKIEPVEVRTITPSVDH